MAIDPDLTLANQRLTGVLVRTGKLDDAVARYEAEIGRDPRKLQVRFGLAMTHVRAGDIGAAIKALEDARAAFPGEQAFTHLLARVLAGSPDPAWADGRRALALLGSVTKNFRGLGETVAMANARAGNFERAIEIQTMVVEAARKAGMESQAQVLTGPLQAYRTGNPWEQPWPKDSPVFLIARDAHPYPPQTAPQYARKK